MEPYEIAALAQRVEQAIGTEEGDDGDALDSLKMLTEECEQANAELAKLRAAVYDASLL